jgi:transcriptional regulator with XRE-family HTH domain
MSLDKMAELISMDRKTMTRWLEDSRKYRNEDFLTILCLIFKLPDWLSMVLFKRAHFMLDEEDKRHEAILHILRVQTEDGIEAANEYLCKNHLSPLTVEG